MANGRVLTGFSLPYVAAYTYTTSSGVTYSSGQILARGVSVSLDITSGDDNKFYADNQAAESVSGQFQEGTCTLTVDGLLTTAENLILGTTETSGVTDFGDLNQPYMGIGFIARYMSGGTTSWVPMIIPKAKFNSPSLEAATQEEDIDWQTQELTADILRDDTANHIWLKKFTACTTEALAEAQIKNAFSIA